MFTVTDRAMWAINSAAFLLGFVANVVYARKAAEVLKPFAVTMCVMTLGFSLSYAWIIFNTDKYEVWRYVMRGAQPVLVIVACVGPPFMTRIIYRQRQRAIEELKRVADWTERFRPES